MVVMKNNSGQIVGWQETYFSDKEALTVSTIGSVISIQTRDRTTGKVDSKTFLGKLLPSDFSSSKK